MFKKTHIAAFNEYTEYHINFDDTSKYYTLVISGMQFLDGVIYGKCLTPTPPLQPTVNKKPKPIANKFSTWFLTTIQQTVHTNTENKSYKNNNEQLWKDTIILQRLKRMF